MSTHFGQQNLPGSTTARDREMGRDSEPLGDHGQGDKSWTPPAGEQGISNRPDDAGGTATRNDEDSAKGEDPAEDAKTEGPERASPATTIGDAGGTS